jgi:PRC-barrel domain
MLQQGLAFKGFTVEATDGRIGSVSDFLFDETTWTLRWLVVDTGNWLMDRKLLLHPSAIDKVDTHMQALLVKLTRDQVEKSPGIETDEPVSRQMEHRLIAYYGVNPLGGAAYYDRNGFGLPLTGPGAGATDSSAGPADPHLRSLAEVTSYHIEATDGAIGHVECFLIDDESWDIRYLVVDTANWWFGRHVLLAPSAVQEIDWGRHRLHLNLTCYKIKGSPPWDPTGLLDRAYEKLLRAYYGWPDTYLTPVHKALPVAPAEPAAKVEAVS